MALESQALWVQLVKAVLVVQAWWVQAVVQTYEVWEEPAVWLLWCLGQCWWA